MNSPSWLTVNCLCSLFGYLLLILSLSFEINFLIISQILFGISTAINSLVTLQYILDFSGESYKIKVAVTIQIAEMFMAIIIPFYFLTLSLNIIILLYLLLSVSLLCLLMTFGLTLSPNEMRSTDISVLESEKAYLCIAKVNGR